MVPPRLTFPPEHRIRRSAEYSLVKREGTRHFTRHFVMVVRQSQGVSRIGVTASRQIGGAVVRNRWKRAVREAFRHERALFPTVALDLVVIAKKDMEPPTFAEARDQVRTAFKRFGRP